MKNLIFAFEAVILPINGLTFCEMLYKTADE